MASVTELSDADLDSFFERSQHTLVEFGAEWCRPCRAMAPVLERLAEADIGVAVARVDVEANPAAVERFAVGSIPTLVLLRVSEPVASLVGARGESELREFLATHANLAWPADRRRSE